MSVDIIRENSKRFLMYIVANFKIFIDTCSLLSEHAEEFWNHIIPVLREENESVIVPFKVYKEIEKYADNEELCKGKDNPDFNKIAKRAQNRIIKLQKEGLVKVYGSENDNFADNVFLTVFTQFRMKYNLILITCDKNLTNDILKINESKAVITNNKILVRRINRYGYLSEADNKKFDEKYDMRERDYIPENERFAIADSITRTTGSVDISFYPKEGDNVISKNGKEKKELKLCEEMSSGGEGIIYTTENPNVVAKIYKKNKLNQAKYEKLRLMITKDINCQGVCFPKSLLYNKYGEFVGYLMNKARGKELQKSVFNPMLLRKYHPDWKKRDTVQLCITILKKLKYLHDRNIILGDINPNNILVVSPEEVYFVDTDSYQIEGYPCPVGTVNFTAPEIQRRKFDTFLRTIGNERFAVATLLFMIMLPGKLPYSLQGGEDQVQNIINGDFAYAAGEKTNKKTPEGMWRYIWSHLPRYLKDDFYYTFRKYGKYSTEKTRFSDDKWINEFERYLKLLSDENGKFLENDSMSAELFPTRLKRNINRIYIECKDCGREFSISIDNAEFFNNKGLEIPKRCPACRKRKQSSYSSSGYSYSGNYNTDSYYEESIFSEPSISEPVSAEKSYTQGIFNINSIKNWMSRLGGNL